MTSADNSMDGTELSELDDKYIIVISELMSWNLHDLFQMKTDRIEAEVRSFEQYGGKEMHGSSMKIYDLPVDILEIILEPLDGDDLIRIAGAHQKLLHATKDVKNKDFEYVVCVPTGNPANLRVSPEVLEILLHGALVRGLNLHLDARLFHVDGMKLRNLQLDGQDDNDKAAIIIEQLKPEFVDLYSYENRSLTPRLSRALSTMRWVDLGGMDIESIDFLTEWKFNFFRCFLRITEGQLPSHIYATIRQLLGQPKRGERDGLHLQFYFRTPFRLELLDDEVFGPDYPLQRNADFPRCRYNLGNSQLEINIAQYSLQICLYRISTSRPF